MLQLTNVHKEFNGKPVLKGNEFVFKIPKGVELDDQR